MSPAAPRQDDYPSRVGGGACILERKDPVLYGTHPAGSVGPLRPADRVAFERDGFLVFSGLLPPARTEQALAELERLLHVHRDDERPELVREPGADGIRSIFAVHRLSPFFARLAADRLLLGIAEQLLGSRVYLHQSRVNRKPGIDGREFFWHSDFETWHVEDGMPRMRAVSLSINLTTNHAFNGPLMLVPGSHRFYVSCAGRTPERNYLRSLRRQEVGVPDAACLQMLVERGGIAAPTGNPGSAVAFDCNTLHGSNGNITPYPRTNLFFVYNSVENALTEPFSGQPPRPDHIASRDFTPLDPA